MPITMPHLLGGRLGVEDLAGVEGAERTLYADFARQGADPDLAELSAAEVHGKGLDSAGGGTSPPVITFGCMETPNVHANWYFLASLD